MLLGGFTQCLLAKMDQNNFYSIDKLIEFGMGIAMAQQMVKIMNETMQNMYVPGSPQNIISPQSASIYVVIEGNPVGPISEKEFSTLVTDQRVTKDSLVWMPGMLGWKVLEEVPNILRIIALTPPPLPII